MPSDIFIKTTSGWQDGKAKNIFIKTSSSIWSKAKHVWLFFDAGWTRVWPLSGIFATRNPFISTTSSSTELSEGTVLRVGTTYRGNRGTWNPNGYTISSYQYKWVPYSYEDTGDLTTNYDPALVTLSTTTTNFLIPATNYDRSWITFFVTAKASGGTPYDGSAESFRYYVVRQKPRISVGTSPSLNNLNPKVNDVITYSSSWDTSDAYRPEAARTLIVWYRNTTASLTGATAVKVSLRTVSGADSYTVSSADTNNYIIAQETTFNSGSDYELGSSVGVSASVATDSPVAVKPAAPTSLTATSNRTDGVQLTWSEVPGANYYEIYYQSSQGTGPANQSAFADFGQDNTITTNSFLDTNIAEGATRFYRVRARISASAAASNNSDWFPAPGSNAISGTRVAIIPETPTNLNGSPNGTGDSNQTISLTWDTAVNAETYEIYFNGTGTAPSSFTTPDYGVWPLITTNSFTTPANFSKETIYYFWVRSSRYAGTKSGWSAGKAIRTNSKPTGGIVTVTPSTGIAGTTQFTATPSQWVSNFPITYTYSWQRFVSFAYYWESVGTGSTFTPTVSQNSSASSWKVVVTATNTMGSDTAEGGFTVTIPPIIPTITMGANTGVTATTGTINWSSISQATFSSTGTFSESGSTATSISKTGLTPLTEYTGTVTVTSSTGHTASANYSLTTPAVTTPAPGTPNFFTASVGRTDGVELAFSGSSGATSYDLYWNVLAGTRPAATVTPDFSGQSSPFLDTTISPGQSRQYWVRGKNDAGTSEWFPTESGSSGRVGSRSSAPPFFPPTFGPFFPPFFPPTFGPFFPPFFGSDPV